MLAVGAIIWIIDHHKTAIEDLAGLDKKWFSFRAYLDMERSGAKLAWDFLHNVEFDDAEEIVRELKAEDKTYTPAPLLLKHVQDRDLWKFLLPKTKELNAALFSYEFTFANWDMLMAYGPEELAYLASQGEALDRKQTKDVKYLIDVCQRMAVIGDSCVPVASIPHLMSSEAGDLMSLAYNNGNDFAATYFDTDKKRVFSLRSQTWGKDVSLTAKHYGGGGHKHAAGFSVPRDHPLAQI